jgi:DNA-binding transcriptional ArsR family regulator
MPRRDALHCTIDNCTGAPGSPAVSTAHAPCDPFDALGDANRRAILRLLSDGDKAVAELADALPISRPAVSRHLRLLKNAGLVTERPDGTRRIYRVEEEGLQSVRTYLEGVWGEAAVRFRLLAENTAPASDR